MGGKWSKDRE
uniref:Nef protein n=1 Tax=Human immunodeficiency virus type 1 TaxID=11676 RepID=K0GNF3_HV1|nr:nef protein [Human immunodeficiency virus 1]